MKTIVQNIHSYSRRREEADTALSMESRLQPALTPPATLTLTVTYGNL